jgi:hypothetical protein
MCYSMKDASAKHVREHTRKVETKKEKNKYASPWKINILK